MKVFFVGVHARAVDESEQAAVDDSDGYIQNTDRDQSRSDLQLHGGGLVKRVQALETRLHSVRSTGSLAHLGPTWILSQNFVYLEDK